jgi:hypothetical protein
MNWVRFLPASSSSEHGNEASASIKAGEFLNRFRKDHLLKSDSALLSDFVNLFAELFEHCKLIYVGLIRCRLQIMNKEDY